MIPLVDTNTIYIGDGKTKIFPFSFKYIDVQDIKVSLHNISEDVTVKLSRDYYVDENLRAVIYPGYAPGQELPENEQPAILDSNHKLVIYRDTPITQLNDLGDKYPLALLECMDDKAILILQEIAEKLGRCVMTEIGSVTTAAEMIQQIHDDRVAADTSAAAAGKSEKAALNSQQAALKSEMNAADSEKNAETYMLAAQTSEANAKNSADAAAKSTDLALKYSDLSKEWAVSVASPDNRVDTESPTMKTQSSRSWAMYSRDKAAEAKVSASEAAEHEANAMYAMQQSQAVVDDAVKVILDNMSAKDRLMVATEDNVVQPMAQAIDVDTGEIFLPTLVSISEAVPSAGATIWLRVRSDA